MQAVGDVNPLMQPVCWEGQWYYTSNYYHVMYLHNVHEHGQEGKYERHGHFLDALRAWPSYHLYLGQKDIIVLSWRTVRAVKTGQTADFGFWSTVCKANGWHDLVLLNQTAQAELYHHLEDPLSQETAYLHSMTTAQQLSSHSVEPRGIRSVVQVKQLMESVLTLAEAYEELGTQVVYVQGVAEQAQAGVNGLSPLVDDVQGAVHELTHRVERVEQITNPEAVADLVNDLIAAELQARRQAPRPTPPRSLEGPHQTSFRVPPPEGIALPPPGTMSIYRYLRDPGDEVRFTLVTKTDYRHFHACCRRYENPYRYQPSGDHHATNFYQPETIRKACVDYQRWLQLGRIPAPKRYAVPA